MGRKLLTPFIVAALAIAFAAASLWVWLGKGKNARAIRTKFKIGGLLLTFTAAVATQQSCTTTCYDTTNISPKCTLEDNDMKFVNGERMSFSVTSARYDYLSFKVIDGEGNTLQRGFLQVDGLPYFVVSVGDYVGNAKVRIYEEPNQDEMTQKRMINSFNVTFEAAPAPMSK